MAKQFKNLNQLFKHIQREIDNTMINDIVPIIQEIESDTIQREVYSVYKPVKYQRNRKNGGLQDTKNMKINKYGNGLIGIENVRKDEDTGRLVAPIVESGKGYVFPFRFEGENGDRSRPFTKKTMEMLKVNKAHVNSMKLGLKKRGFDIK